jgi:hypothetical protein
MKRGRMYALKKLSVLLFSLLTLAVTAYGLLWPNYMLHSFIEFSESFVQARVLLAIVLFFYTFSPHVRTTSIKLLISFGACLSLAFGIITMFSPMFMGRFNHYVPIGDVFIFLEGGILALLAVVELPTYDTRLRLTEVTQHKLPVLSHFGFLAKLRMIYNPTIRGGT